MSSLGMKFSRKAQVLGKKFKSKARLLGTKANQTLRIGDTVLRKAENTIKNKVLPASMILAPESAPMALGALGVVKSMRSQVAPARQVADRLEKINLRKEAEDLANNLVEQGSNFV
jgi:hypothetical protein